ncbi:terpene synthase family protein [Streptomyces sp. NPDC127092]|uniref:terpene synthase family protein n=1 Tax=Streptomyces sp. NPDC127092 TaxID=3347135 RepID=UPI00365D3F42
MTPQALPVDFGIPVLRRIHPDVNRIGERLGVWAAGVGLTDGPSEEARLRSAGFHLISSRFFSDAPAEAVELFARWVVLLFHLDDQQDEGPMGRSPDHVRAVYQAMTSVIDGDPPAARPAPAVAAMADLWPRTADGLSGAWRLRFRAQFLCHRDAFLTQVTHRERATVPTRERYPALRRDANGMFMWNLVEAALRTEVPAALADGALWREMCEASNDVTAWCNDVLSLKREIAAGEVTNYVIVLQHATGCDTATALDQVCGHIRARYLRLTAIRAELVRPIAALPAALRGSVARIADIICAMPGTQLAWFAESGRYQDSAPVSNGT